MSDKFTSRGVMEHLGFPEAAVKDIFSVDEAAAKSGIYLFPLVQVTLIE